MQLYICILFVTDLREKSRSELSLLKYLEKIIFECIGLEEFVTSKSADARNAVPLPLPAWSPGEPTEAPEAFGSPWCCWLQEI